MAATIPLKVFARHKAVLGMTGSGKTSVAKVAFIEPALQEGERVLILDPTGVWWGLRLDKDGKDKGFPIHIFGGRHGDYPLKAADAEVLAEAFGKSTDSAIFDTQLMSVADRSRFFINFANALMRTNRGAVNLVIDEAHIFIPQVGAKAGGLVPEMIHAGNNLVSGGRVVGLRVTLISQRPAKLHKDSLTQCQVLIAMMVMHPLDRKAIMEWIDGNGDPAKGKEIEASLAKLNVGEGWVWSPLDKYLERSRFPLPKTFDSSQAPDTADGNDIAELAPLDMGALSDKLAKIKAEVVASDPKILKAEIARLSQELRKNIPANNFTHTASEVQDAFDRGRELGVAASNMHIDDAAQTIESAIARLRLSKLEIKPSGTSLAKQEPIPQKNVVQTELRKPAPQVNQDADLPGPQRRILGALAFWKDLGHMTPSRQQVAFIAGYSPTSTGFSNPLGYLKAREFVSYPAPGLVQLMVEWQSDVTDPKSMIFSVLPGPQTKILNAVLQGGADRETIASRSGYSATSTGFSNPLGNLKALGIVTYPSTGRVAMADWAAEVLA